MPPRLTPGGRDALAVHLGARGQPADQAARVDHEVAEVGREGLEVAGRAVVVLAEQRAALLQPDRRIAAVHERLRERLGDDVVARRGSGTPPRSDAGRGRAAAANARRACRRPPRGTRPARRSRPRASAGRNGDQEVALDRGRLGRDGGRASGAHRRHGPLGPRSRGEQERTAGGESEGESSHAGGVSPARVRGGDVRIACVAESHLHPWARRGHAARIRSRTASWPVAASRAGVPNGSRTRVIALKGRRPDH